MSADPMSAEEPPQRDAFGVAVAKRAGAALGVVVLMAGAFAFVGARDDQSSAPTAADLPDVDPAADPDLDAETGAAPDDGGATSADTEPTAPPEGDDPASAPDDQADDAPAADDPAADDADDTASDADADADTESDPEADGDTDEAPSRSLAPADVTIQVLDGYKADGGTAARGVAEGLRGEGYRVIAERQALNYEVTTVLWTTGNEAAARQVAAEIGAGEVRAQPGNLSESVAVHVVVGADRA